MLLVLFFTDNAAWADDTTCQPVDPVLATASAREQATMGEYGRAVGLVARAKSSLHCAERLLEPEDLAALFQVGGAAALGYGEDGQGKEWMDDALRLAPGIAFDPNLGEQARRLYEAERAESQAAGADQAGTLQARRSLRLDGEPFATGEHSLAAGWHLVQTMDRGGVVHTGEIEIQAGEPTPWPDPVPHHGLRVGLAVSGSVLALGGVAALTDLALQMPGYRQQYETAQEQGEARMNALLWSGIAGVSLGAGALVLGATLDLSDPAPSFGLRGQF